jgi:hypothetical protein
MGANAQTSVPVFTSGQVLTAQQQTEINTGIPVFATSVERDAAFGGTGEKTLAEGQFAFLEDSDTTQYYDGSSWEAVGVAPGLVLVSSTTIDTAVSFVEVPNCFSADYDNYKILINGGVASTNVELRIQLGATTTGYYAGVVRISYAGGVVGGTNTSNLARWDNMGDGSTSQLDASIELRNPFLSKITTMHTTYAQLATAGQGYMAAGFQNSATSFTDFTLLLSSGTITGGTIRVYGYTNS